MKASALKFNELLLGGAAKWIMHLILLLNILLDHQRRLQIFDVVKF